MKNKISDKIRGLAQKTIPVINMALLVASCGGNEKDYCTYDDGTKIVDKDNIPMTISCEDSAIKGLGLDGGKQWALCRVLCKGNDDLQLDTWFACQNPSVYNQVSNSCVLPQGACQYTNGRSMERPYEEMRCDDSRVFDALRETVDPSNLTGKHKCSATCLDNGEIKYEYHGAKDSNIAMIQAIVKNKMHTM